MRYVGAYPSLGAKYCLTISVTVFLHNETSTAPRSNLHKAPMSLAGSQDGKYFTPHIFLRFIKYKTNEWEQGQQNMRRV